MAERGRYGSDDVREILDAGLIAHVGVDTPDGPLVLPMAEASAKVRSGDPVDDAEDMAGDWWAGVVPLTTRFELPTPAADLTEGIPTPTAVANLAHRTPDTRPPRPMSRPEFETSRRTVRDTDNP